VKAKVIPVIIDTNNTWATYQESTKLRKYKKQPYWALSTTESTYVKVQNLPYGRNNITCSTNCKYRTPATICTLATWFVSSISL
jgi:hypothetical protein